MPEKERPPNRVVVLFCLQTGTVVKDLISPSSQALAAGVDIFNNQPFGPGDRWGVVDA